MIQRSLSSNATYIAALLLTVIGGASFNILPLLTAGAEDTLGFSDRQVGIMSLFITIGSGSSALFAAAWVRSVHWPRATLIALGGVAASNVAAMLVHHYWIFVLLQGIAGVFAAAVLCLAVTMLSDRPDPARAFGMSNALQVVYQICGFLAGPTLLRLAGLNGVLALLAALGGLGMLLTTLLPAHGRLVSRQAVSRELLKPSTVLALLGFGAFFVNAGAYWTYIQIMGEASGMSPQLAANSVAVGVSAGIFGGATAWVVGGRFGRLWPLLISCGITIGGALLVHSPFGVAAFISSVVLYFFAWNCAVAYQLSLVNALDSTGRGIAITQAGAFLGAAAGAGLAALLVKPGHYEAVIMVVVVFACLSTALFALALMLHRHVQTAPMVQEL